MRRIDHIAAIVPAIIVVAATKWGIYVDGFIDVNLDPVQSLRTLMHAWNPHGFLFGTDSGFWQSNIFVTAVYAFLIGGLHINLAVAERIWLFALVAFSGYGIQYLLRQMLPELKNALLVAPAFYVINIPFFTSLKEGSTYALTSYAALPFEIGLVIAAARGGSFARSLFWLGVLSAVFASSNPPINVLSDVVVIGSIAMMIFFRVAPIGKLARLGVASASVLALMAFWWLLPFAQFMRGYYLPAFNGEGVDIQSRVSHFANEIRGMGLWAFGTPPSISGDAYFGFAAPYLSNPIVIIASFIAPLLAIAALLFPDLRRRAVVIAISLMGALSVMLAASEFAGGPGEFGNWSAGIYGWIYGHVPFFAIFRASYKWQSLVQLWIALLASATAAAFASMSVRKRWWARALGATPYLAIASMAGPMLVLGVFTPQQLISSIPSYWIDAGQFVQRNTTEQARLFELPEEGAANYSWGQVRGDLVLPLFHRSGVADFIGPSRSRNLSILTHFAFSPSVWSQQNDSFLSVLQTTSSTHILKRYDFDWNESVRSGAPISQAAQASRIPRRKSMTFGALALDELREPSPMIYTTERARLVSDESDYEGLLRLGTGTNPAIVDVAGLGNGTDAAFARSPRSFESLIAPSQVETASIALATAAAPICTTTESRFSSAGAAYKLVLQDRALGLVSSRAGLLITIDGGVVPSAEFLERQGDYLVLGNRFIEAGQHTCAIVNGDPSEDVRLFLIPTEALNESERRLRDANVPVGIVAAFDGARSQQAFNFTLRTPGAYHVRVHSDPAPAESGIVATLAERGSRVVSRALPAIFGEGFVMNDPAYQGYVDTARPLDTTVLRSVRWLADRGSIFVFAPKYGTYALRARASTIEDGTTLRIESADDAQGQNLTLRRANRIKKFPIGLSALADAHELRLSIRLAAGWNRLKLSSDGRPQPVSGVTTASSVAIWSFSVSSPQAFVMPPIIGVQGNGESKTLSLRFSDSVPSLQALKSPNIPLSEISALRIEGLQLSTTSAQAGLIFGLSQRGGSPTSWVQIPFAGANSIKLSRERLDLASMLSADVLESTPDSSISAIYFYAFGIAVQGGVSSMNDAIIESARPVGASFRATRGTWRFEGEHGTTIDKLSPEAVDFMSPTSLAEISASHLIIADVPLKESALRFSFSAANATQPQLALAYGDRNKGSVFYPGDSYAVDRFEPDRKVLYAAIYSGRLPDGFKPQFDDFGQPKAMWLLRDGRPLSYVSGDPSLGQWNIESTSNGWYLRLSGRDVFPTSDYRVVIQSSSWYKSDGLITTATFPGSSFDRFPLGTRDLVATLHYKSIAHRPTLLTISSPEIVVGASVDRVAERSPLVINVDGRIIRNDTTVTLPTGAHRLSVSNVPPNDRGAIVVEPAEGLRSLPSAVTHVDDTNADNIEVSVVRSLAPCILVFAQTHDPNWIATANGTALDHFRVNFAFNGFVVPPGVESIRLRYATPSTILLIARLVSFLTFVFLAVFVALETRRKRLKARHA